MVASTAPKATVIAYVSSPLAQFLGIFGVLWGLYKRLECRWKGQPVAAVTPTSKKLDTNCKRVFPKKGSEGKFSQLQGLAARLFRD